MSWGEFFFSISQHIKVSGVTLDEYILPYHFIIIIPNWFTKISWSKQPWVLDFSNLNVANYVKRFEQVIQYNLTNWYRIIALFGACAYSRKNAFWELIENVGAPILYILRLTSVRLYASRGELALKEISGSLHPPQGSPRLVPKCAPGCEFWYFRCSQENNISKIWVSGHFCTTTWWKNERFWDRGGDA